MIEHDSSGKLPATAWPGSYPIIYILIDGAEICASCANGERGSLASETTDDKQWRIEGSQIHWEGPPSVCEHCGALTESAYGYDAQEED